MKNGALSLNLTSGARGVQSSAPNIMQRYAPERALQPPVHSEQNVYRKG